MTTFIKTKFKISDLESPSNFRVKEKNIIQIGPETTKLFQTVIWGKYYIEFGIQIKIPSQRKENYSNRSRNNEIGHLWS